MSVVINLLDEHCNNNNTCRKFAALLLRLLTMVFWHADRAVTHGFLLVLLIEKPKVETRLLASFSALFRSKNLITAIAVIVTFYSGKEAKTKIETRLLYWTCLFFFPNINVWVQISKIGKCFDYVPQIFQITCEILPSPSTFPPSIRTMPGRDTGRIFHWGSQSGDSQSYGYGGGGGACPQMNAGFHGQSIMGTAGDIDEGRPCT
jgi:hypothetical protein